MCVHSWCCFSRAGKWIFSPRHFPLHASRILELLRLTDPDSQDRPPAGSSEDEEVSEEKVRREVTKKLKSAERNKHINTE